MAEQTLSLLSDELETYVRLHCQAEDKLLQELRAETQKTLKYPQMQVGPVEGALLRLLVSISGVSNVLEIGTFSGYSALCMAAALPDNGRLVTCDIDPVATAVAQRYFNRSPYGNRITLCIGDAITSVESMAVQGETFDMVFLDADKKRYVDYWDRVLPMIPAGGLISADNTLWSGRVLAPVTDTDHGIIRFNDHVVADTRVEQVMLPIRDGVTVCRRI